MKMLGATLIVSGLLLIAVSCWAKWHQRREARRIVRAAIEKAERNGS